MENAVIFVYLLGFVSSTTPSEMRGRVSYKGHDLIAIPDSIPVDTTELDFSLNKLTEIRNNSFTNLTNLAKLCLAYNRIRYLEPESFEGLSKLLVLDLTSNKLQLNYASYPSSVFRPLVSLQVLHMIGNLQNIEPEPTGGFPEEIFRPLTMLKEMSIDLNSGVRFGDIFVEMKLLRTFSVSCGKSTFLVKNGTFAGFESTRITSFSISCFDIAPGALEVFKRVSYLNISAHDVGKSLRALQAFQGRNLTQLRIHQFTDDVVNNFKYSSLSTNNAKYLSTICVKRLDLSDNFLFRLDPHVFHQFQHPECLEELYLQRNSLHFGPNMLTYLSLNYFKFLKVVDLSSRRSQVIQVDPLTRATNKKGNLKTKEMFKLEFPVPKTLQVLNLSSSIRTIWNMAPFSIVNGQNLRVWDISYSQLHGCNFLVKGFENLTVLNITQMDCTELSSDFLADFVSLQELVMSSCNLHEGLKASPTVFHPLINLRELDLTNNHITRLPMDIFSPLKDLSQLNLAHNKLISIPEAVFPLHDLCTLDLSDNVISSLNAESRKYIDSSDLSNKQRSVILRNNPLLCTCDTVTFVRWSLTSTASTTTDLVLETDLTCQLTNGSEVLFVDLKNILKDFEVNCVSKFWLTFSVNSSGLLVFSIIVAVILYRNRVKIMIWFKAKCWLPTDAYIPLETGRFRYDAFVAYNHEDHQFACVELRNFLEENHTYTLCIHDRDFDPGSYIVDEIINAINSSRKIILVVTRAFLSSNWCDMEIQLARMRVCSDGVPDSLVVILYEHIQPSEMPRSLLTIWNEIVFLVWNPEPSDQAIFWERLAHVMEP